MIVEKSTSIDRWSVWKPSACINIAKGKNEKKHEAIHPNNVIAVISN